MSHLAMYVKTSDGGGIILKWKVEVVEEESEYLEKVKVLQEEAGK